MEQIKSEKVTGVVRNTDSSYTVKTEDGRKHKLDRDTANSLLRRLDKDRSKMERERERKERK